MFFLVFIVLNCRCIKKPGLLIIHASVERWVRLLDDQKLFETKVITFSKKGQVLKIFSAVCIAAARKIAGNIFARVAHARAMGFSSSNIRFYWGRSLQANEMRFQPWRFADLMDRAILGGSPYISGGLCL